MLIKRKWKFTTRYERHEGNRTEVFRSSRIWVKRLLITTQMNHSIVFRMKICYVPWIWLWAIYVGTVLLPPYGRDVTIPSTCSSIGRSVRFFCWLTCFNKDFWNVKPRFLLFADFIREKLCLTFREIANRSNWRKSRDQGTIMNCFVDR